MTPLSVEPGGAGSGELSRRAMLAALARWSVPTVLTIALAARPAAAVSCPPCTRKIGGRCRACTTNQILNCNCEPCLGPPYCAGAAAAFSEPRGALTLPPEGTTRTSPLFDLETNPLGTSPFRTSPFGRNPYTARPYGVPRDSLLQRQRGGLYDRLRTDQRRPF